MKKLQNNFTTQVQSKRLLELGVPADSADCYYVTRNSYTAILHNELFTKCRDEMIKVSKTAYRVKMHDDDVLPCWSAGRLIEILVICKIKLNEELVPIIHGSILDYLDYKLKECSEANIIKLITGYISINLNYIDFSKLEEE